MNLLSRMSQSADASDRRVAGGETNILEELRIAPVGGYLLVALREQRIASELASDRRHRWFCLAQAT